MILRLVPVTRGAIRLDGADVTELGGPGLRRYYADVQGVFQDPFSSYNPIFKVDRVFTMIRHAFFPDMARGSWDERVRPRSARSASTATTSSASTRTSSRAASSSGS